jgi:TonB family C-terminal domain
VGSHSGGRSLRAELFFSLLGTDHQRRKVHRASPQAIMSNTISSSSSLHDQYSLHLQIGFVLSLGLLLAGARLPLGPGSKVASEVQEQETVHLRHIQQTRQEKAPPAPPRPPVPQAVPNDRVIAASNLEFDRSLDLDAASSQSRNAGLPSREENRAQRDSKRDEVFVDVQQRPDCGGLQSLNSKVRYPPSARAAELEGQVFVQFVVDTSGQVTNPQVVRSTHPMLGQAALRAVKKLDCTPGRQRSRPVKVKMTMPVAFTLKD